MDEERVAVKTHVPRYQKEAWAADAADLDMSQSEFLRAMVQAGRRGFDGVEQGGSRGANPGGTALETVVLDVLSDGPLSWEALRAAVLERLEDRFDERLEESLADLQSAGRVRYSGPAGGYVVDE